MLFLILGLLLFVIALQVPFVQTKLTRQLTKHITEKTGFDTSISKVQIRWWDAVSLKEVLIYDQQDSLMIKVQEIYIDFSIKGLLDGDNPGLDQVKIINGNVRIIDHQNADNINITTFFDELNGLFPKSNSTKESVKFSIGNVFLEETSLDILNYTNRPINEGFDYNKLKFRDLLIDADDFYTYKADIGFKTNLFRGIETTSGIVIQQLKTNFTYTPTFMEFDQLFLKSNETEIKDYLKFSYLSERALSYFDEEVLIHANLNQSTLDIKDLTYFTNQIPDIKDKITLSGEIKGEINNLFSDQLLLRFGERSALFGKFSIKGLPYLDNTFFKMTLINSILNSTDLKPYISDDAVTEINKFKDIRFDTDFSGYISDFTANGNFQTDIGQMIGKLNYKFENNKPTYNGSVELKNLDLGVLLEDKENFQKVSLTGQIKGSGLTLETALLQIDADINKLGIYNYDYVNIQSNATYGKDLFSGKLRVNDPNLRADFDGIMDLREHKDSIRLTVRVDTAFLQELNIIDRDLFITGKINMNTKGITLDDIEGIARFSDLNLSYEGRNLFIDNFFFQSLFTDQSRVVSLNSDYLVAGMSGNFKTQQLIQDVETLSKQYWALLTNSSEPKSKIANTDFDPYNIDLNINFIDINPLINLIEPKAFISKNTLFEGAFYQTPSNTILNLFSSIDTIYYDGNFLFETNLDFNTSKLINSKDVLASFYIFSKQQKLTNGLSFNNLGIEAIWDESKIDLTYNQDQFSTDSYFKLSSEIRIFSNQTSIIIAPSELKILDKTWQFAKNNQINIANGDVKFDNIKLINEDQFISLNGNISSDPEQILKLQLNKLNLDFFNTLSLKSFEGTANGIFAFSNLYQDLGINGNLNVRDFYINNFLIGDIDAATFLTDNKINLELSNFRNKKKVIGLSGYVDNRDEGISLKTNLNGANISILEPFLSDYLTQMGGTVDGELDISGTINAPVVLGSARVNSGTLKINYLNTLYTIDGNLLFGNNEISFRELLLKDVNGNLARMRGGITHDRFRDFLLDISSNLENFQVLNTSAKDNELFYGTAYVSGTLKIFGAANNLDINARATSKANTRIIIPLGSSNVQAQEDFINIINVRRDTIQKEISIKSVEKLAINNVRMNFELDITPDAYTEIQIDPRTGENIQGRGRGVLTLKIDTQGNFSMLGNYEITEAKYNFSLYNIIRREFVVQSGGRISWFGDPYEGVMDLRAIYQESISLQNLQNNQITGTELDDPQLRRRWPLKVIMDLKGDILSPDIAFDFDFTEFPEGALQTYISAFKNRIANDEQEKNRQVFSVIMMRSFSPEGQFSGVGNIASSNLSQLLSSQLNSFISQVDQNLEVDIDLATLDQSALETFQLRVAYTFLDGRLRVTRDGGFTDLQGNADINSIAGDWNAEYLITQDGRYRMRIYNRNNFNTFTSLSLSRNVATYGISLSQNLAFNSFQELLKKITSKNKEKLRINDNDDFLRYQFEDKENWQAIPLDNLDLRIKEEKKMEQ